MRASWIIVFRWRPTCRLIDTQIIEVPNPSHPYGVRGVGETPIVAPLATASNAVSRALGQRVCDLPLSPPRLLNAIDG